MENNIIYHKCLVFSKLLFRQMRALNEPSYKVLIHQLTKSGSSIGANVSEAQSAESLLDFLHKMKMADKELNETFYWLEILDTEFPELAASLRLPLTEIQKILKSILLTSTRRLKERKTK